MFGMAVNKLLGVEIPFPHVVHINQ